ncbi:MAG: O-antigen ligase family protein [Mycobacteriales bacterium]
MTIDTPPRPPSLARPPAAPVPSAAPAGRRRGLLRPGWPLSALIVLFPLWWALGLMELIFPLLAVPMAVQLFRRRPLRLPPGFVLWALFLLWVLAGAVLLGVNPPRTLPAAASTRLIAYAVRLIEYLSMTVVLLYVGNLKEHELPRRRLIGMLGWFFLVATLGGLLGTFWPAFEFTGPIELLLPAGIRSNIYVQSLVHPQAAQVQDLLGYSSPRPKAPFDYTNSWGNNMVILGVWFVAGWWASGRPVRRLAMVLVLCVAAVPLVYSLNRGVWIGIGFAAGYVALRVAIRGRPFVLVGTAAALALCAAVVLQSPLGQLVQGRLENPQSNSIRASLNEQSVQLALASPVLGYGGTRNALGSPQSITVGRTSSCARCGNFAIGSTGQLWQLLVSTGFVGAALYFGFFLVVLWRYRHDRTVIGIAGSLVVVVMLLFALFYNVLASPLFVLMVSVGLLWRNDQARAAEAVSAPGRAG